MARQAVTSRQLLKIEGIEEILKKIAERLPRHHVVGPKLKDMYLKAALPIQAQAKRNIDSLPLAAGAKTTLKQQVVAGRGPARFPNAFVSMYQWAATAQSVGPGGRIPNPYWFEFGTALRETKGGHRTGQITATPYFRPAITQARGKVKLELEAGLKRILVE
jgi:hypothetical protein